MAKKKKTYRTSGKPKVAAMNEYIYNTLKDDLAKEYKVARPFKPKKVKKAQIAKKTNLKAYKASPAELARARYKGPKFSKLPGASKPMPTSVPKGVDARINTKSLKKAGYLTESAMGGEGVSKAKFGIPKGKNPTIKKGVKKTVGDVIGYQTAKTAESTLPVKQQRLSGTQFKPSGKKVTIKDSDTKTRKVPGSKYVGGKQPVYKSGTSSPVKLNKKAISGTAKKTVLARGAKLAAKGASRLIPGVGTALLAKDVYDVLTTSEATKYVPQFGAKNPAKKYKKRRNY